MLPWAQGTLFQLHHLVHALSHGLHTFEDLKYHISKHMFFSYLKFKHSSLSTSLPLDRPTKFEYVCTQDPYQLSLICTTYNIFHEAIPLSEVSHSYMSKLAHILQQIIPLTHWKKIWASASKNITMHGAERD